MSLQEEAEDIGPLGGEVVSSRACSDGGGALARSKGGHRAGNSKDTDSPELAEASPRALWNALETCALQHCERVNVCCSLGRFVTVVMGNICRPSVWL